MKDNTKILSIVILIVVISIVMLILLLASIKFKDVMTIPQSYCESSGGYWNYYESYNVGTLENPKAAYLEDGYKVGYWCDYPDGASKSEEDIMIIFNSTEMVLT